MYEDEELPDYLEPAADDVDDDYAEMVIVRHDGTEVEPEDLDVDAAEDPERYK